MAIEISNSKIPKQVQSNLLTELLQDSGMELIHQGKVRDTFRIPGREMLRAILTTDRISVFNYVLPVTCPYKGDALNALSIFFRSILMQNYQNDLVAFGMGIDEFVPSRCRGNRDLQQRLMIVEDCNMVPAEAVPRECLTGTGYKRYKAEGDLWGISLPIGLHDGALLPQPYFTVTDKSDDDLPIMFQDFVDSDKFSGHANEIIAISMGAFAKAQAFANRYGFLIADTKFEFGLNHAGKLVLCDEVLTPDSSRFWSINSWVLAKERQQAPVGYDKQPVRDWFAPFFEDLKKIKEREERLAKVSALNVPKRLIQDTTDRYLEICSVFTGHSLQEFWKMQLGAA